MVTFGVCLFYDFDYLFLWIQIKGYWCKENVKSNEDAYIQNNLGIHCSKKLEVTFLDSHFNKKNIKDIYQNALSLCCLKGNVGTP